jgi:hypothetical protein
MKRDQNQQSDNEFEENLIENRRVDVKVSQEDEGRIIMTFKGTGFFPNLGNNFDLAIQDIKDGLCKI